MSIIENENIFLFEDRSAACEMLNKKGLERGFDCAQSDPLPLNLMALSSAMPFKKRLICTNFISFSVKNKKSRGVHCVNLYNVFVHLL
ncbi:MAG: hypothetical protein TRG1_1628 [Flavobacteriaceae bacterium FS1-H7996/R]|nr:MAG: hypothetical protein TRG1_1628 [Flavobacteriaceae bacterium FS1-H7996/R]